MAGLREVLEGGAGLGALARAQAPYTPKRSGEKREELQSTVVLDIRFSILGLHALSLFLFPKLAPLS